MQLIRSAYTDDTIAASSVIRVSIEDRSLESPALARLGLIAWLDPVRHVTLAIVGEPGRAQLVEAKRQLEFFLTSAQPGLFAVELGLSERDWSLEQARLLELAAS